MTITARARHGTPTNTSHPIGSQPRPQMPDVARRRSLLIAALAAVRVKQDEP
jgi:hypothetical protein